MSATFTQWVAAVSRWSVRHPWICDSVGINAVTAAIYTAVLPADSPTAAIASAAVASLAA